MLNGVSLDFYEKIVKLTESFMLSKKFRQIDEFLASGVAMVHLKTIAKNLCKILCKILCKNPLQNPALVTLTEKTVETSFWQKKQWLHWKFHKISLFSKLYRNMCISTHFEVLFDVLENSISGQRFFKKFELCLS